MIKLMLLPPLVMLIEMEISEVVLVEPEVEPEAEETLDPLHLQHPQ